MRGAAHTRFPPPSRRHGHAPSQLRRTTAHRHRRDAALRAGCRNQTSPRARSAGTCATDPSTRAHGPPFLAESDRRVCARGGARNGRPVDCGDTEHRAASENGQRAERRPHCHLCRLGLGRRIWECWGAIGTAWGGRCTAGTPRTVHLARPRWPHAPFTLVTVE